MQSSWKAKFFAGLCVLTLSACAQTSGMKTGSGLVKVSGEQRVWRSVTLDVSGPESSETAAINPFTDYRFDVTFTNKDKSYVVPGYFAACGDAAVSSCEEGDVWRVHFTPDVPGKWRYQMSFKSGEDVILTGTGKSIEGLDGLGGVIDILPVNADSNDPRDRGRLQYVGKQYLEYAQTGEPFFKAGADAPENMFAFSDFDATPNRKGLRKDWAPHKEDGASVDLNKYGWNGKGQNILGAVNYLAEQGLNAVSFLTFNVSGDDQNVFPHLLNGSIQAYEGYEDRLDLWEKGVFHDRFDVSKMDQWGRVLSFANDKGMFLHFKLQETENDNLMDDGDVGVERIAYLREIIARYGHFLALNWNIGEENNRSPEQQRANIKAVADLDPYDHLRVIHTYPREKFRYISLLGDRSALTGASLQGGPQTFVDVRHDVIEWVLRSKAAGKPWAVAYDEAGSAAGGVPVDGAYPESKLPSKREIKDARREIRKKVLWATLTGGGYGVEYYYGYKTGCTDLNCQDHRTRASKWQDAAFAIEFFDKHVGKSIHKMEPINLHPSEHRPFMLGKLGEKYVIYAHNGKSIELRSVYDNSSYNVSWFDPSTGQLVKKELKQLEKSGREKGWLLTGEAPGDQKNDWVILVEIAI